MLFFGPRGARIFRKDLLKTELVSKPSCALDPEVGRDPAEDDGSDSASSKLQLEVCSIKGSPLPFRNYDVCLPGPHFWHELCPIFAPRPAELHRLIRDRFQPVCIGR